MDADALLQFLGLPVSDQGVLGALALLARGMLPELDPDDDDSFVDWVSVNEIGLEFGFEDEAYVKAKPPEQRRQSPLILSQLYFYGDTPTTRAFPFALPLGLSLQDDRSAIRSKLAAFDGTRRSYIRDAWNLPAYDLTVAYRAGDSRVESVLCHLRYAPWPTPPDDVSGWTHERFVQLFGTRWSDPVLRSGLEPFDIERSIGEIRSEHEADYRTTHGVELVFSDTEVLAAAKNRKSGGLAFSAVRFYASRVFDACQWPGPLPFGLSFDDSQRELVEKIGSRPEQHEDETLTGMASWQFDTFDLNVEYSNVENRILRLTVSSPGY
jgi:hypothetical protein